MVNLDNVPNFETVLEDFLLPSVEDMANEIEAPVAVLCPARDMDIWRKWSTAHSISLIVLPLTIPDLNPCDEIWKSILKSIAHFKFDS